MTKEKIKILEDAAAYHDAICTHSAQDFLVREKHSMFSDAIRFAVDETIKLAKLYDDSQKDVAAWVCILKVMDLIGNRMREVAKLVEQSRRENSPQLMNGWECNLAGLEHALAIARSALTDKQPPPSGMSAKAEEILRASHPNPPRKLWCAACGTWGNHTSGGCPHITETYHAEAAPSIPQPSAPSPTKKQGNAEQGNEKKGSL